LERIMHEQILLDLGFKKTDVVIDNNRMFINKWTKFLFIPLLREVWFAPDDPTPQMFLVNRHMRVNIKRLPIDWIECTFSFDVLFRANPNTMIIDVDIV